MKADSVKRAVSPVLQLLGMVLLGAVLAAPGWTQPYPGRPIRLVLPFPPGGNTDILGRIVAQNLSERLGQPVVSDNRAGLGGYLGLDITSKAVPDGHTITIASMVYASGPLTYPDMKFNPVKDLTSIGQISEAPNFVVVHPAVPAKSLKELVEHVRANPKKLNYATSGTGSTLHLATAMLNSIAKMDIVHVPYKGGGGPAMNAVVAGEVQLIVLGPAAIPHFRAGRARALAVLSEQRIPVTPEVPTAREQGFDVVVTSWHGLLAPTGTPRAVINRLNKEWVQSAASPEVRERLEKLGFFPRPGTPEVPTAREQGFDVVVTSWHGLLAPAGTPRAIINRLNKEWVQSAANPEVRGRLEKLGFFPRPGTPEQFTAYLKAETARWTKLIKEVGIQPER